MNNIQGLGPMQGMMGMMGMQGMQGMMGMHGGPRGGTLTDEQKEKVKSILSQFDSSNVTAEDAQSFFQQLREAGITPGRGLKETIEEAGFDAENLRQLGMSEMQGMQGMQGMRGMGQMQGPPPPPPSEPLTDEQKTQVKDILSNYDAQNLTAADAKSILEQLRESDIKPGEDLKNAIEDAGFNADQIFYLARPSDENEQGNFWASQAANQNVNLSLLQSLQSILSQYDLNNLSSDQQTNLTSQLLGVGFRVNLGT